jgi:anti-sigma factor RsiW
MQCSEFEIRLCDYLDRTLDAAAAREAEEHAKACPRCAGLVADAGAVHQFLERVEPVEAPADLATRVLYRTQDARSAAGAALEGWRRWFRPLLAPRFVMSMAMTILSLSMFARVTNISIRQLEPADLNPAAVWRGIDTHAHRVWNRGVKLYENFRLFYQIMSQLQAAEAEETAGEEAGGAAQPADPRRSEPAKGSESSP